MSSSNSTNVPQFTEEKRLIGRKNWVVFKREVKLHVGPKGLLGYLEGTIPRPNLRPNATTTTATTATQMSTPDNSQTETETSSPPPPPPTTTTGPTQPFDPNPSIYEWDAHDRWVTSTIVSNIVDPVGLGVDENKWACLIWGGLRASLDKKSEELISGAEECLRNRKLQSGEDFDEHVHVMRNLVAEARNVGSTMTDAQFHSAFINSLGQEWDEVVINLPGTTSEEAIAHLEAIWIKQENW
ncbi:hypothetical protein L218DRAFT_1008983 [Marasmius fiardii PR-910]|nr:hypothetical protein L218DRAFT_1008983 [Marasmius fiardii PR-910]